MSNKSGNLKTGKCVHLPSAISLIMLIGQMFFILLSFAHWQFTFLYHSSKDSSTAVAVMVLDVSQNLFINLVVLTID